MILAACIGLFALVIGVAGWVAVRLFSMPDTLLDGFGDDADFDDGFDPDFDESTLWWLTDMEWRE